MHPMIQHTPSVLQEGVTTMEPWVSLHLSTATISLCPILANSSKSGFLLRIRCSCLHHLSSVPILVTTVCLCAKREIITLLLQHKTDMSGNQLHSGSSCNNMHRRRVALSSTDWLRLPAMCSQSVCVFKRDGSYLQNFENQWERWQLDSMIPQVSSGLTPGFLCKCPAVGRGHPKFEGVSLSTSTGWPVGCLLQSVAPLCV